MKTFKDFLSEAKLIKLDSKDLKEITKSLKKDSRSWKKQKKVGNELHYKLGDDDWSIDFYISKTSDRDYSIAITQTEDDGIETDIEVLDGIEITGLLQKAYNFT